MYEMKPSVALPGVIRRHLRSGGTCLLAMKLRYENILKNFLAKADECNLHCEVRKVEDDSGGESGAEAEAEAEKLFGGSKHLILVIRHRGSE
mmetsp:Transcript_6978/g.17149  ORF Transcript_6978/g.17149 Transcript_6978/m.17149 type:complete len:92 (+) Transcript_6978:696-971(+)